MTSALDWIVVVDRHCRTCITCQAKRVRLRRVVTIAPVALSEDGAPVYDNTVRLYAVDIKSGDCSSSACDVDTCTAVSDRDTGCVRIDVDTVCRYLLRS